MQAQLDHRRLYRLPWSLPDNSISWLEPTAACNLACFGCYRENEPKSHKSLEQVDYELDVFTRLRKADGISIAGGDPLCHPQIADIVARVHERGIKPILNTNGLALTPELLAELKRAGLWGLTLHIDSKQNRPHWKNKSEVEHCELRLDYAEMIAEVGGLSCSFNSTVYEDTLPCVPDLVDWAHRHIDIVNVMVFITFRAGVVGGDLEYYMGGDRVELDTVYATDQLGRYDIQSTEVLATVQKRFPDFRPCAYLNGTERPDSFKWLLSARIGTREKIYGYVGPRFMEVAQTTYHLRHGRYPAYAHPKTLRHGRSMMLLSPLDPGVRGAAGAWLRTLLTRPQRALGRAHLQSIMMIQPVDVLPDGRQDMCDACPDQTVWHDRLVWSCRLEEPLEYGGFLQTRRRVPPQEDLH
jgi:Radical SAM superfamily/4Fe-4S single cluster domain